MANGPYDRRYGLPYRVCFRVRACASPVAGKDRWSTKELDLVATLEPPAPTLGNKWGAAVAITPSEVLTPPVISGVVVDDFGAALAMTSEGTLAVGAPGTDIGTDTGAGMVSVYTPDGTGFDPPQQLMPTVQQIDAAFGSALAATDTLLAVGAPNLDDADGNRDSGAVYAYTAPAPDSSFTLTATLQSGIGDKFGAAVGVEGSTIVVGAPLADTTRGPDTGAGYVYEGDGSTVPTTPTTTLVPQGIEGDGSGASVAINDGVVVLGAPLATREGELASGAAFVFRRLDASWAGDAELSSERELVPLAAQANQQFGASLALTRDLLVTGAPNRDRSTGADQGDADAFAFDRIFAATFE